MRRQHARLADGWRATPAEHWTQRQERALSEDMPTFADACLFMAVPHEALRLGQLAAWGGRVQGLQEALRSLAYECARHGEGGG